MRRCAICGQMRWLHWLTAESVFYPWPHKFERGA